MLFLERDTSWRNGEVLNFQDDVEDIVVDRDVMNDDVLPDDSVAIVSPNRQDRH